MVLWSPCMLRNIGNYLVIYTTFLRSIAFTVVFLVEFGTAGATVGAVPYVLVGELVALLVCTCQMIGEMFPVVVAHYLVFRRILLHELCPSGTFGCRRLYVVLGQLRTIVMTETLGYFGIYMIAFNHRIKVIVGNQFGQSRILTDYFIYD